MKRTIDGFVYYIKYEFSPEPILEWNKSPDMGQHSPEWVKVGPYSFEVECPDDFDPRPQQIAALDEKLKEVRAEFVARVTELQAQRSRLLAITMEPA